MNIRVYLTFSSGRKPLRISTSQFRNMKTNLIKGVKIFIHDRRGRKEYVSGAWVITRKQNYV